MTHNDDETSIRNIRKCVKLERTVKKIEVFISEANLFAFQPINKRFAKEVLTEEKVFKERAGNRQKLV